MATSRGSGEGQGSNKAAGSAVSSGSEGADGGPGQEPLTEEQAAKLAWLQEDLSIPEERMGKLRGSWPVRCSSLEWKIKPVVSLLEGELGVSRAQVGEMAAREPNILGRDLESLRAIIAYLASQGEPTG